MQSVNNTLTRLITIIFIILFFLSVDAETRYKDYVFPSVSVTKDIQFGSNTGIDGSTLDLLLDLYEPSNDTETSRPLVIMIHGGSLISSSRGEMGGFCSDFAKRGYVAATIEYRLGIESPKGEKTIMEALLRGVQDTKAAVRYFYANAETYHIDTSRIYLMGSSAGSMLAVHYAYWDQDEIPSDVDQAKWGNIEGASGNPGYPTTIKGIVSYAGAILDINWIDADEPAVANFHGLLDPVVPPDDGISTDFGIRMRGGVAVSRTATELGIYNQGAFFPQMAHGGNEDSLRIFSSNFIYSLIVLSKSVPQDFSSMELNAESLKIFRYDTYSFFTSAIDKDGNKIILPHSMIEYSCDSKIGTIAFNGIFTPSDVPDSGYVYAEFNNATDACYIKTYDLKYFEIIPGFAVTDTSRPIQLKIDTYDADSVKHDLAITKFILISTVPSVGTIDSSGIFTGKRSGKTRIIAYCSGFSDTCTIRVENASGMVMLDAMDNLNGWTISGNNLDQLDVIITQDEKSEGDASIQLDYKFTYSSQNPTYWIYLDKDIPVYGIPDSIFLDVKSDGRRHKLFYRFTDANQGVYRASGKRYLNDSLEFAIINAPMTGLARLEGTAELTYPLIHKRTEIQLAGNNVQGQITSGTLYVDNLRFKYPGEGSGIDYPPSIFDLEQNYPNPFNPGTVIGFHLLEDGMVILKIYDMLGREVTTLIDKYMDAGYHTLQFNGSKLASGIYLYRLQANQRSEVKKMMLLK